MNETDVVSVLVSWLPYLVAVAVFVALVVGSLFTIDQQTAGVVERFGKFHRAAGAGLNFKIPFIESVDSISLQVQQLPVTVETKTSDNVFVKVVVAVQYSVLEGKVFDAYYKLDNPAAQLSSYVFDVVRAKVPTMKLDDVFERKDDIANAVRTELADAMDDYGYTIAKALVTDIDPDPSVKHAMNEINAAQRLRVAATEKGEAEKVVMIARAEAEATSKKLQGQGIADQRKALVDGLRASIAEFQAGVVGASANDVMQLVLMTQYFDTLKDIGASGKSNTVFLPHAPGSLADLSSQLRNAMLAADAGAPTV